MTARGPFQLPKNHHRKDLMRSTGSVGADQASVLNEKVAWPSQGIHENSEIKDYTWGYLIFDGGGNAGFDISETPTKKEILARWGHLLVQE